MIPGIDTNNIERIGVHRVGICFEEMGWTFRERIHSDYGIDADAEQKVENARTNRHIALQIKSGDSYIKVKKNGKITFSIDSWHYSYWLQSDRPVLILLYDPESKNVYWEQVRLSVIKQADKYKKIEISTSKILNENSLDELNDIISTYVKHEIYVIDEELVTFDYSIMCIKEYSSSLKELVDKFSQFKDKIQSHYSCPQTDTLCLQLNVFGMEVYKHIESDYALLHKACWYLAYLSHKIDNEIRPQLVEILDEYIDNLIMQKASWIVAIEHLSKLFHPNIPRKVQSSTRKVIRHIEDYAALVDLAISDFIECKTINANNING